MIVVTTPTGQIGRPLVDELLANGSAVRVIVRDASKLDAEVRDRVDVIEGSHSDPAVLDRAFTDADAVFWLVPPEFDADPKQRYVEFARLAIAAARAHDVSHIVGVSSAGHGWHTDAGLLTAAFDMDAEFEKWCNESGTSYRALCMPWFMENMLRNVTSIRDDASYAATSAADQVLPAVATQDIAAVAAKLLTDRSWNGYDSVLVIGPDRLTPTEMAGVIGDVLGKTVTYSQLPVDAAVAGMRSHGASEGLANAMEKMFIAQNQGVYDADIAASTPTPTSFRDWCEQVLKPAVLSS